VVGDLVRHRAQQKAFGTGHSLVADDYKACVRLLCDVKDRIGGVSLARVGVDVNPGLPCDVGGVGEKRFDLLSRVDGPLDFLWGAALLRAQTPLGNGRKGTHKLQRRPDGTGHVDCLPHRLGGGVRAVGSNHDRAEHDSPHRSKARPRAGLRDEDHIAQSPRRRRVIYDSDVINQGDMAPDFELSDQDGRMVRLDDFRGQTVVLFFYPKADTPGCTTQACGVRDHRADYASAAATVLGVSPDRVAKVKKFHDKHSLDFALLADEDHRVAESYGVWVEKSMYGRKYFGNERTTFIVDPEGRIAEVLRKVKPVEHDERVLQALRESGSPAA
jgi:peroxiredoxin Q/BCP